MLLIKIDNPREGTETPDHLLYGELPTCQIKIDNPREGTETLL